MRGQAALLATLASAWAATASVTSLPSSFVNSLGMNMTLILPGSFVQGWSVTPLSANLTLGMANRQFGDADESPYQRTTINAPFYMATKETTNIQYEMFDPSHRALRGKQGWSIGDQESAVFLSWDDTVAFAEWVSARENRTYRLPTESEWEYACRAGTTTYYNTGDDYPAAYWKNQGQSWYPGRPGPFCQVVNLTVAEFPPNAWGLYDMHGNVEEWCSDWFAPYGNLPNPQPERFRVTRGGSHSTEIYFLRSANRAGAVPADRSWFIGLRLVADAVAVAAAPKPTAATVGGVRSPAQVPRVSSASAATAAGSPLPRVSATTPVFLPPLQYVRVFTAEKIPFTEHNHDPALAACLNGDVFATWFSTITEPGRESGIVSARLPVGGSVWEDPVVMWSTPDRMDNAPNMWLDPTQGPAGVGRLFHFHGMSAAATWGNLAVVMVYSDDCGRTWSNASIVMPEHGLRHQPVNTMFRMQNGSVLLPTDNTTTGSGGTALHFSNDGGYTWTDPDPSTVQDVLGIHGTLAELKNGSLLAFGRGNDINGMMAQSRSDDRGYTWTYTASSFPGIGGGQRAILLRLQEGPLLFCSFADVPMAVPTQCGAARTVQGFYCALSTDEGTSFPQRRVVSDDGAGLVLEQLDGVLFTMNLTMGEGNGYSVGRQGPDGTIHLITSRNHYRFNAAWAAQPAPCVNSTHEEL